MKKLLVLAIILLALSACTPGDPGNCDMPPCPRGACIQMCPVIK